MKSMMTNLEITKKYREEREKAESKVYTVLEQSGFKNTNYRTNLG